MPPTRGPQHAWYIQRNLRAGMVEEHPAHTIVVAGDVKQGASVIAGGNILVFGKSACTADNQPASPALGPGCSLLAPSCPASLCRLQGEAHAGCKGDRNATITALEMSPMQLRIADVASYAPRNAAAAAYPEVASVDNSRCECFLHRISKWLAVCACGSQKFARGDLGGLLLSRCCSHLW